MKLGKINSIDIFGENVPPYKVASDILKHLLDEARTNYADLTVDLRRAIITIPINFNGVQRKELREAAREAGIEITTFIHEPFAAIIGYFFTREENTTTQQIIKSINKEEGKNIITFDWGGGTLDITIVRIEQGKMIEVGTAELTGEAGDKFDEIIAKWAWNKFLEKYGNKYDESILEQKKKENWDKFLKAAEESKISLSDKNETNFIVISVIENIHFSERITREDFSKLIDNILIKAINQIDKAIKEAQLNTLDVDMVLLTGGTCHIPAVQNKLIEKFGHKVRIVNNSELLIAQGAAVISEMGWLPFLTKDISIQLSDDSLVSIFEKDTNIAVGEETKKSEDLVCCDNRGGEAKIIIVESSDGNIKDKNLTILKVPVLNDSRFNDDIKLDATIDENIILKVCARSLMVRGYKDNENYAESKEKEIHQLCFGLNFND